MTAKFATLLAASAIAVTASVNVAAARDQIQIVGSSTVFPFSTSVAETFGQNTSFKTPVVEATGSGGGMKLFCSGVGEATPDITNASRRIKEKEFKSCIANGVTPVEVKVGFDGIVLGSAKGGIELTLTRKQIFNALAKQVVVDGKLVDNPYKTWSEVDPSLPNIKIEVLGPPPTSGTRDAFVELAMEGGAKQIEMLAAKRKEDKSAFKKIAHAVREDGAYVEAGENDNLIVQKLQVNPDAFGIFGYSFLDQNSDKVQGSMVGEVEPTFENIADGAYPISRSLYFYVKKAHVGVIPGIEGYLAEFISEDAAGEDGYLADKGLIPMSEEESAEWVSKITNLENLSF